MTARLALTEERDIPGGVVHDLPAGLKEVLSRDHQAYRLGVTSSRSRGTNGFVGLSPRRRMRPGVSASDWGRAKPQRRKAAAVLLARLPSSLTSAFHPLGTLHLIVQSAALALNRI
jgi:hypothetical protein